MGGHRVFGVVSWPTAKVEGRVVFGGRRVTGLCRARRPGKPQSRNSRVSFSSCDLVSLAPERN